MSRIDGTSVSPMSAREARRAGPHGALDDIQALFTGTAFIALGIAMYSHSGLLSGGTAGLAFLANYLLNVPFGAVFFVLNLPFYWLAWRHLGRRFTLKTLAAVSMLSGMVELQPHVVSFQGLDPLYAAVLGGLLMGTGFLILFRHKASLGGVGIVALVLQERKGWRAGHVQMAIDCAIVVAALISVEPSRVLFSVAGAVALNMVLAINHRPGRYVAQ